MKRLHDTVEELFRRGDIDVLLGWRYDPLIADVRPILFKKHDGIDEVIFDERCVHNLTSYLPTVTGRYDRVGVILKGCDGRSLLTQIVENRINKHSIVAIAVECKGVRIDGQEAEKCFDCASNLSPIADFILGEQKENAQPEFKKVREVEEWSPQEKWKFFSEQFSRCTRCYACRQICPLCYCELCIADQQEPKWIEPSSKLSANTMWHLVRAYHLAGRCADCAECERVCPEDIPLRLLNNAIEEAVIEMFNVRPGTVFDELPPLVVLSKDDPDELLGGDI